MTVWKRADYRFTVHVFRERLSIYVCVFFGFEGGVWHSIVLIPDHCLSIYFGDLASRTINLCNGLV